MTKKCVCDAFWTENFFKAHLGGKTNNCGTFSLFYVLSFELSSLGNKFYLTLTYKGPALKVLLTLFKDPMDQHGPAYHALVKLNVTDMLVVKLSSYSLCFVSHFVNTT